MTILETIKEFFKECPIISSDGVIRAEYLGDKYGEYSIEVIPGNPIVKQYIDGSSVRQFICCRR